MHEKGKRMAENPFVNINNKFWMGHNYTIKQTGLKEIKIYMLDSKKCMKEVSATVNLFWFIHVRNG